MPWSPETTLLGTVKEFESFNYSIQYYTEETGAVDPITGEVGASTYTYYPVTITPTIAKTSVSTSTGDPATITGLFQYCFNDTVVYRGFNNDMNTLVGDETTGAWEKMNDSEVFHITSFTADRTRDTSFSYYAEAKNGSTVVASQTFTIRVYDPNWTNGQNTLRNKLTATEN